VPQRYRVHLDRLRNCNHIRLDADLIHDDHYNFPFGVFNVPRTLKVRGTLIYQANDMRNCSFDLRRCCDCFGASFTTSKWIFSIAAS